MAGRSTFRCAVDSAQQDRHLPVPPQMNMQRPAVFVLLPVHNRREITRKFVGCLAKQTYRPVHLVLIDDGSNDGTADMVKEILPDAQIVTGDGSWWWSGCMQRGYERLLDPEPSPDDMVLIANDDITYERNFIEIAVRVLAEAPHSLLGAQLRDPEDGGLLESGVNVDMHRFVFRTADSAQQINCLPTRALMLRWGDMRRIGGFHPQLLPQYWADYEYTIRAVRRGLRCFTSPSVAVTADLEATGQRDLDSLVGWRFMRQLFSIKTPLNPLYRTSFAILASSGPWKLVNMLNVWARAGFRIVWQGILRQRFPRSAVPRMFS
jgi:GT2 family glycosyltransferase